VKLKEWDYDAQHFAQREYPDEIIKEFVDWFRVTKAWREDTEMVFAHWLKLERDLTDAREEAASTAKCWAPTKSGAQCEGRPVEDGLCMAHAKVARVA
jgi:hypothetical protein